MSAKIMLEKIKKIVKAVPKGKGIKAKCPFCFTDIKIHGDWPNYWSKCSKCGNMIRFSSYIDAIKNLLELADENLKDLEWAKDLDVSSGIY